jgi:hypothetical protein
MPYIEKVAEPGAGVVFLVHHRGVALCGCKPTAVLCNAVWRKHSR